MFPLISFFDFFDFWIAVTLLLLFFVFVSLAPSSPLRLRCFCLLFVCVAAQPKALPFSWLLGLHFFFDCHQPRQSQSHTHNQIKPQLSPSSPSKRHQPNNPNKPPNSFLLSFLLSFFPSFLLSFLLPFHSSSFSSSSFSSLFFPTKPWSHLFHPPSTQIHTHPQNRNTQDAA